MAISSYYTPGRGGLCGLGRCADCRHRGGASSGQAATRGRVSEEKTKKTKSGSAEEAALTFCHR